MREVGRVSGPPCPYLLGQAGFADPIKESCVKTYVGQTRAREQVARCRDAGLGELTCRGELPPRRHPWCYDNGAFKDWRADRPFNFVRWIRDLRCIRNWILDPHEAWNGWPRTPRIQWPDFIVLPDIPNGGNASLKLSLQWLSWARWSLEDHTRYYLAVQNGMDERKVRAALSVVDGIFVGGTLEWKMETGAFWVDLAHRFSMPCHIGRVGTLDRVRWAQEIGADSIDSSLPLWRKDRLEEFISAVGSNSTATFI